MKTKRSSHEFKKNVKMKDKVKATFDGYYNARCGRIGQRRV